MVPDDQVPIERQWLPQRNYHYLRYAILAFFLLWIAAVPNMLQSEFISLATVGYLGMTFSVLCVIMDLRNYWLFVDEERDLRQALGKVPFSGPRVTFVIILFYLLVLAWFSQLAFQRPVKHVHLTENAAQRILARGKKLATQERVIVTVEKFVYLPDGWTKITSTAGEEFIVRNDDIQYITNHVK